MTTFPTTKFPYLQAMGIIIKMEQKLASEESTIAYCLKKAIADKAPAIVILQTTKDMIQDNYSMMADIFGNKLTVEIKNFEI